MRTIPTIEAVHGIEPFHGIYKSVPVLPLPLRTFTQSLLQFVITAIQSQIMDFIKQFFLCATFYISRHSNPCMKNSHRHIGILYFRAQSQKERIKYLCFFGCEITTAPKEVAVKCNQIIHLTRDLMTYCGFSCTAGTANQK